MSVSVVLHVVDCVFPQSITVIDGACECECFACI